jgi:hypothetical protein
MKRPLANTSAVERLCCENDDEARNTKIWVPRDSNPGPTSYASHRGFHRPFRVRGLDYPFALATRASAV